MKQLLNEVFIPSVALFSTLSGRTLITEKEAVYREQFLLEELSEMYKARTIHDILDAQIDFMWFAIEALYLTKGTLPILDYDIELDPKHILDTPIKDRDILVMGIFHSTYTDSGYAEFETLEARLKHIILSSFSIFVVVCDAYGVDPERAITEVIEANMSKFYFSKDAAEADVKERGSDYEVKQVGEAFAIIRIPDQKTMKAKHFKAPNWDWIYE